MSHRQDECADAYRLRDEVEDLCNEAAKRRMAAFAGGMDARARVGRYKAEMGEWVGRHVRDRSAHRGANAGRVAGAAVPILAIIPICLLILHMAMGESTGDFWWLPVAVVAAAVYVGIGVYYYKSMRGTVNDIACLERRSAVRKFTDMGAAERRNRLLGMEDAGLAGIRGDIMSSIAEYVKTERENAGLMARIAHAENEWKRSGVREECDGGGTGKNDKGCAAAPRGGGTGRVPPWSRRKGAARGRLLVEVESLCERAGIMDAAVEAGIAEAEDRQRKLRSEFGLPDSPGRSPPDWGASVGGVRIAAVASIVGAAVVLWYFSLPAIMGAIPADPLGVPSDIWSVGIAAACMGLYGGCSAVKYASDARKAHARELARCLDMDATERRGHLRMMGDWEIAGLGKAAARKLAKLEKLEKRVAGVLARLEHAEEGMRRERRREDRA